MSATSTFGFLRMRPFFAAIGRSRASGYADVKDGFLPPTMKLSAGTAGVRATDAELVVEMLESMAELPDVAWNRERNEFCQRVATRVAAGERRLDAWRAEARGLVQRLGADGAANDQRPSGARAAARSQGPARRSVVAGASP